MLTPRGKTAAGLVARMEGLGAWLGVVRAGLGRSFGSEKGVPNLSVSSVYSGCVTSCAVRRSTAGEPQVCGAEAAHPLVLAFLDAAAAPDP